MDSVKLGNSQILSTGDSSRTSVSNSKQNFKTFSLLRQQENLISQFESNLQKTIDLLNKRQTHRNPNAADSGFLLESTNISVMANEHYDPQIDCSTVIAPTGVSSCPKTSDIKHVALENENKTLRKQIKELEKEREILRKNLNSISLANQRILEQASMPTNSMEQDQQKSKIQELEFQNDHLKQEVVKVKIEASKKCEQLQKENEELFRTYEQRVSLFWLIYNFILCGYL